MADLTQTSANVHVQSINTKVKSVVFGEAMTAGMPCYRAADGMYYQGDADDANALPAINVVIVGAGEDLPGLIATEGPIDIGATLTVGVPYIVSATKSKIAPASDFAGYTGADLVHLGYATATDTLDLRPYATGASN